MNKLKVFVNLTRFQISNMIIYSIFKMLVLANAIHERPVANYMDAMVEGIAKAEAQQEAAKIFAKTLDKQFQKHAASEKKSTEALVTLKAKRTRKHGHR